MLAADWCSRRAAHEARVDVWLQPELRRRSLGEKHPVMDFLFEYYPFRPSHLRRWSPGLEVWLDDADELLEKLWFEKRDGQVGLASESVPQRRRDAAAWMLRLIERTAARRPMFGCYGLHEWAMVVDPKDVRHGQFPLRMPHNELREWVASMPIRCSHFDAFRFFSEEAKPMNQLNPQSETRADFEQPGCLHANMDLYKWAFKLSPWVPAELMADCFELAMIAREVDMRASPYDFSSLGYVPIAIETATGRAEYEQEQRRITDLATPLREKLITAIRPIAELA